MILCRLFWETRSPMLIGMVTLRILQVDIVSALRLESSRGSQWCAASYEACTQTVAYSKKLRQQIEAGIARRSPRCLIKQTLLRSWSSTFPRCLAASVWCDGSSWKASHFGQILRFGGETMTNEWWTTNLMDHEGWSVDDGSWIWWTVFFSKIVFLMSNPVA